ncbi:MAG: FAD-dependent monooxygenase, partial [Myxococcales bacterium]|nr:FAD-dependent monooxygenase [Myxococcales bacterium]
DELGLEEAAYSRCATRFRRFVFTFDGHFETILEMPRCHGRDYLYGVDRAGFDALLWSRLEAHPGVDARAGVRVRALLRDDAGRVVGVEAIDEGGAREHRGRCVIGADGRFSLVARKAGARVLEDVPLTSTAYQAEWSGVAPALPDGEGGAQVVASGRGRNLLLFPAAPGRHFVVVHARSDRVDIGGDAQAYYDAQLASSEVVRRRLAGAERCGPLVGVKRIANRYVEHAGDGWLLVGDAVHCKDPADGQGIYDALIEAKRLAPLLVEHLAGARSWASLSDAYGRALREETEAMFRTTCKRLKDDLYSEPPALVIKTLIRWMMTDPEYTRRFLSYLSRVIPPDGWMTPGLVARVVARGIARDVRGLLRGRSSTWP